jgi:hypothetical protein
MRSSAAQLRRRLEFTVRESSRELALRVIQSAHDELSVFGQDSYAVHGRGVIRVGVSNSPAAATIGVFTEMVYHTLAETRDLTDGVAADSRADVDVLLRMIETYEPTTQAVVMVDFAEQLPVAVKMRLDEPLLAED